MISMCFMVALNNRYGIGEDRLGRVTDAANGELEQFAILQRAVGMERAKKRFAASWVSCCRMGFSCR